MLRIRIADQCIGLLLLAVVTTLLPPAVVAGNQDSPDAAKTDESDRSLTATHKQVRIIKPLHNGSAVRLNTFCLDGVGNILACVSGPSGTPHLLQTYGPDGDLLREVELEFRLTAVNPAPDGTIFVAGSGKVGRVSADGKVMSVADAPHLGDPETMRQQVEAQAKKQLSEITASFRQQVEQIEKRIAAIQEVEESERTKTDQARLATFENQKKLYQEQCDVMEQQFSQMLNTDTLLEQKRGVTSLAVNSRDLFLCCHSLEGYGYEVWRLTHEFSDPQKVVQNLGGCCGQCDIQATEKHLVLAENTKFKVALLDRDGNREVSFGERDRVSPQGFGSCCNPMNVRCCADGDVLTAESSIGTIKRFSSTGEFLGVVGKAKIGGGCKHVALGFDATLNRYYMMNVDQAHICVLVPNDEAPEFTEDELLSKQAMEGLGQKLIGEWSVSGKRPTGGNAGSSLLSAILGAISSTEATDDSAEAVDSENFGDDYRASGHFHFHADGRLSTTGGQSLGNDNNWTAVRQDGNTLLISRLDDGVAYYDYRIEFQSDDTAVISMLYGGNVLSSSQYTRVKDSGSVPPAHTAASPIIQATPVQLPVTAEGGEL